MLHYPKISNYQKSLQIDLKVVLFVLNYVSLKY